MESSHLRLGISGWRTSRVPFKMLLHFWKCVMTCLLIHGRTNPVTGRHIHPRGAGFCRHHAHTEPRAGGGTTDGQVSPWPLHP